MVNPRGFAWSFFFGRKRHVAETKLLLNVPRVFSDPRFAGTHRDSGRLALADGNPSGGTGGWLGNFYGENMGKTWGEW